MRQLDEEGYHILTDGEIIKEGDQFLPNDGKSRWRKFRHGHARIGQAWSNHIVPVRRKVNVCEDKEVKKIKEILTVNTEAKWRLA